MQTNPIGSKTSFGSGSVSFLLNRMTVPQKKAVFFKDIADLQRDDEMIYGFMQRDFGDPFKGQSINPENTEYKNPDFGFNNHLNFEDPNEERLKTYGGLSNNWRYVMDFAERAPRFERVRNYINHVNEQKYYEESTKYAQREKFPELS